MRFVENKNQIRKEKTKKYKKKSKICRETKNFLYKENKTRFKEKYIYRYNNLPG